MHIGDRLRNIREDKDLKQTEVAKAIHITNKVLSSYERNISLPTIDTFVDLCNYYHVSADYILQTDYLTSPLHSKTNARSQTTPQLNAEQKRVLYYYNRLNEENRDAIKGLMVTYYKDQVKSQE
ncbi:MAG: helix-turn-helix transcriptional regulator [Lachnospiraceae bacterium]|nr:helix-turn-helix transcriptional regulator [Lachnospiraceae bacterium]